MGLITTKAAAERLGISARRVRALVETDRLPASRIGRDLLIDERHLARVADRKPGRPRR